MSVKNEMMESFSSLGLFDLWKQYQSEPKVRLLGDEYAKERTEKKLDDFKKSPSVGGLLDLIMSDIRIDLDNKAKFEAIASLHFAREKIEGFKPFKVIEKKMRGSIKDEGFVWAGEIYFAGGDNARSVNSISGDHYEYFKEGLEGEPMFVFGTKGETNKEIADFTSIEESIVMIKESISASKKKKMRP